MKDISILVENTYEEDSITFFNKGYYVECDPRTWPFFAIVMPTRDGRGPTSDEECDKIGWEVWDHFYNSYGSFDYLCDAIKLAMEMNKKLLEFKR